MAEATQELRIVITAQDRASSVLKGVGAQVSAANAALAGAMAGAAGAAVSLGIQKLSEAFDFATDSVFGFNASLEQSRVAWATMLGGADQAERMLGNIRQMAEQSPIFEFKGLEIAARRLLGMGFAAGEILPLLQDIGNAAGALGLGTEGIDRISRALGQMATRTKVSAEDMLQLTEVGVPAWRILAQEVGMSVADVQKATSQGRISADTMIQAFQRFSQANYGDVARRQGEGFTGVMQSLQESARTLLAEGFEPLFNGVRDLARLLADWVKSEGVQGFIRGVRALQIAMGMFFQWAAAQWPAFSKPAIDAFNAIGEAFNGFWTQVGGMAEQAFGKLLDIARTAWGFFVELATAALGAVLEQFNRFSAWLRSIRDMGIPLPGLLNDIADTIVDVDQATQSFNTTFRELPKLAVDAFTQLREFLGETIVDPIAEGLQEAWDKAALAIPPDAGEVGRDTGRSFGQGVLEAARPLIESLQRMLAQLAAGPTLAALEDTEKAIERAQLLLQVRGIAPEERTEARRLIRELTRNVLPGQRLAAFDVTEPVRLATRAEQMATLRQQIQQTQVALTVNIQHEDGRVTTYNELIEANGQAAVPPPVQISGVRRN